MDKEILTKINPYGSNADLIDSATAMALRTPSGSLDETSDGEPKEVMSSTEPLMIGEVTGAGLETSLPSQSIPRDSVPEISGSSIPDPDETEATYVALELQPEEETG